MRITMAAGALALSFTLVPAAGLPANALTAGGAREATASAARTQAAPASVRLAGTNAARPAAAKAKTGTLVVRAKALAKGRKVSVKVTGPRSYRKSVKLKAGAKLTLKRLRPGTYTVQAGDSVIGSGTRKGVYWTPVARIKVTAGKTAARTLTYRKAIITSSGLGPLRLGMTVAQAKRSDPSLKVVHNENCTYAMSRFGMLIFEPTVRPGNSLIHIGPSDSFSSTRPSQAQWARAKLIPTTKGLKAGDTLGRMRQLYPGTFHADDYGLFAAPVGKNAWITSSFAVAEGEPVPVTMRNSGIALDRDISWWYTC